MCKKQRKIEPLATTLLAFCLAMEEVDPGFQKRLLGKLEYLIVQLDPDNPNLLLLSVAEKIQEMIDIHRSHHS